jgi:hypothetical protein
MADKRCTAYLHALLLSALIALVLSAAARGGGAGRAVWSEAAIPSPDGVEC